MNLGIRAWNHKVGENRKPLEGGSFGDRTKARVWRKDATNLLASLHERTKRVCNKSSRYRFFIELGGM